MDTHTMWYDDLLTMKQHITVMELAGWAVRYLETEQCAVVYEKPKKAKNPPPQE